jgi:hypothetical protein
MESRLGGRQLTRRHGNTLLKLYANYKDLYWSDIMESRLGGSYLSDMQIRYSNYIYYKELYWSDIMESRLGGSYLTDLQIHYSNYTLIYKELCWLDI